MDPNVALHKVREAASEIEKDLGDALDETSQAGQLITHFDALDNWLGKGGFLPGDWERPYTKKQIEEHIYEKCRDCHLFVEHNTAYVEGSDIAPYSHLARGNAADEKLDGDHEPVPSGMKANLATWQVFGPVAMRERFVTPDEWANY